MMTIEDLQLIVASGEGYNAEFKVAVPSKVREISEEVCAFANAAGGILLIGVNDNNQITGVNIDNYKRSAIQNSLGEISPSLHCSLSFIEIEGKNVGIIEVPSGSNKPYVLSGAIYVRVGPNTQKLTTVEQMRDFFQQSDKIYFDEGPCKEFGLADDFDDELLREFKTAAHFNTNVPDNQIFSNLKLYTGDQFFKNGAVLFFGKQPEEYFEKAIVRCVVFDGKDKRFIVDDKIFGGPLYFQYLKAVQWLKAKLSVRYDIEGQGSGPRKEIWEIPETVFREAIINSLSHRDYYDKGAVTMVEVFDDRVDITNPGGLVSAISHSEFGTKSHSRNPLVFGLFTRMRVVEQIGSGINRMKDLMKEAGLQKPDFRTEGMFTVSFKRLQKNREKTREETREETREKTRDKIIRLLSKNNMITAFELAKEIGVSEKGIEYHLQKLKSEKIIKRIDSTKSGYWEVKGK